jgi:hypothetical protein
MTGAGAPLDAEALRRGVEERDLEAVIGLYADDAELWLVDPCHPPDAPLELAGRAAIREHLREVCNRDLVRRVERLVVGQGTAAYTESRRGPDGALAVRAAVLELREGRIVRELAVEARDRPFVRTAGSPPRRSR